MLKVLRLMLLMCLPLIAEELVMDFKPQFGGLPEGMQSKEITASDGPALLLSSASLAEKKKGDDPFGAHVGKDFYVFGDAARKWRGKDLVATFKLRHLSGAKAINAGYRVFGNGNTYMTGRYMDIDAPVDGEWRSYKIDMPIPDADGIENFNVIFGFTHDGETENSFVIDDLKVFYGLESGLHLVPSDSIGMATLLDSAPLALVKDGRPDFVIVLAEKPTGIAQYAAEELQYHMKLMTGIAPEIRKGGDAPAGTAVWIGDTTMARKYGMAPDMLPKENWVVARVGKDILIAGGDASEERSKYILSRTIMPLGTLDGVYEFLERVFGVRWFWPGEDGMLAPKAQDVSVTRLYETGAPAYNCRFMFYDISKDFPVSEVMKWQRRMRTGGAYSDPIANHSFQDWSVKYGDQPELFALQPNGKRKINNVAGTHLCMTNPKVVELAVKDVVEFFDKNPDEKFCAVMPGDSIDLYYCRCTNCQKGINPEKGELGCYSNVVWAFVNAVAAKVALAKPGRFVKCCSYSGYQSVPDFPLMPNVAVTLCYGALPRGHINYKENWRALINEWSATGAALYCWEYWNCTRYYRGTYGAPAIFPRQLKEIYALDRGQVKGRVMELADNNSYGVGLNGWADWIYDMPNLYMALKLMWNPSLDVEDELQRYYRDFFGPAEAQVREFYDTLELAWTRSCWMQDDKSVWDYDTCWTKTYPPEMVDRLMGLLKDAVRVTAGQEPYAARAKKLLEGYEPFQRNSNMFRGAKADTRNENLTLPVTAAPAVDGVIDDDEWKDAVKIEGFVDSYNVYEIESKTTLFLKCDGNTLYVAAKADTPKEHLEVKFAPAKSPKRDFYLWDWESIELLFAGGDGEIRQFIVAPDDMLYDALWPVKDGKETDLKEAISWNPDVVLKSSRKGNSWRFELAIPLSVLDFKNRPAPNAFKADFARNHFYKADDNPRTGFKWEQSLWLPTYSGYHNVERYGQISF